MNNQLALFGGSPIHDSNWPTWPRITNITETLESIKEILNGSCWTVRSSGIKPSSTEKFEEQWASFCNTKFALAVTSGSMALELALRALEIGTGDEVIVPALGWYATAAAVCRVGATPVFCDIDLKTSCIDPNDIQKCLSPHSKAIIVVHLHCALVDMDAFSDIAKTHGLYLIEDAAQAHGGTYQNKPVGSIGDIGCFSFNQEKLLAVGEGGAVVTNNQEIFQRLYTLRTDGYKYPEGEIRKWIPNGKIQGNNVCISELQSAILIAQLSTFEQEHIIRQKNADALKSKLQNIHGVIPLETSVGTTKRPYYEYGFIVDFDGIGDLSLELLCQALSAELGTSIYPTDAPVVVNPLFATKDFIIPSVKANQLYKSLVVFHHRLLLSSDIVLALPNALTKILRNISLLKS
jgi:L-glutamine:2-deoxy-scyllo-inosose/3-amino-2,3-dideoxy-scyllo-inosose aminotransferase